MKKIFALFLFLSVSKFIFAASTINFGIIGDQTGSNNITQSYNVLQNAVALLNKKPLAVILHVGDLIESTENIDEIKKRYSSAISILNMLHAPWFLTAGDHDVSPTMFEQNSSDRSREKLFQSLYSTQNPNVVNNLYYSFNINGYHFIALYSEEHLDTDPRWGNLFFAHISNTQFDWLKKDLETNKCASGIIVFMHQPLWYNAAYWQKIHALLKQYPVRAVIAGHFHYSQDDGILDGIHYFVVGATGANNKEASANAGGVQQIMLVTINQDNVHIELLPIDSPATLKLTSRENMDKVEAVDQMLSNFYNFSEINPLYIKNNKLVNSCTDDKKAVVKFTSIGNPLPETLELTVVNLSNDKINLLNTHFAPDVCEHQSGTACILKPSARVAIANNSCITVYDQGLLPLWQTTVELNNTAKQKPLTADYLNLKVTFKFTDNKKIFSLYKTLINKIQKCT